MRVAAIDEATGEQDWKPVTDLINYADHATYDVVVRIETADGAISTEQLGVTEEHPFRVFRDGDFEWVSADALSAGDVLSSVTLGTNKALTVSEASVSVQSVSLSGEVEPVYNFTVADFHTYSVGQNHIWVHNAGCLTPENSGDFLRIAPNGRSPQKTWLNPTDGTIWQMDRAARSGSPHGGSYWKRWESERSFRRGDRPDTLKQNGSFLR